MSYIPLIKTARIDNDAVTSAKVLDGTLTDADVAAANIDGTAGTPSLRTLGTGAQQALAGNTTLDAIANPVADIDMDGFKIVDLGAPTAGTDAANKAYVDSVAAGLDPKESVLYTTTGNITLSGTATQGNGTWPSALTAGNRILVKNQTTASENGIYTAAAGAWARSTDFDGTPSSEVSNGAFTLVSAADGTDLVGTGWVVVSGDPIVVNTDDIDFTQITSPGSVSVLNDLTDVDTTGVVTDALLRYDGADWVDTANVLVDDANSLITLGGTSTVQDNAGDLEFSVSGNIVAIDKLVSAAGQRVNIQTVAGDHTVDLDEDYVIVLDTTGALRTATLPATHVAGDTVIVKRVGSNNAEIATADADTIDGSGTNYVIDVDYMSVTVVSDGTNWLVI